MRLSHLAPLCVLLCLTTPSAKAVKYFWQLSDVHVDGDYTATADPKAWCHSDTTGAAREEWFGQIGCGLPWRTVESAVDFMKRHIGSPEAILWTGDTAPHWPYTDWSEVFPKLRRVSSMLRNAFPDAQILPAIGNHDAYPSDQFPDDNGTYYQEYLERSGWGELLPEEARRTFRRGGFYAVDVGEYRVIVLNTALYYTRNKKVSEAGDDPTGQIAWLAEELKTRKPTIVTAHLSPGFPHWSIYTPNLYTNYNYKLHKELNRVGTLEQRIANIFGHEHIDTFQNVYRTDLPFEKHTYALNTYFMAPALMPGTLDQRINPSVRLYALLPDKLNDYVQFHFNLDAANKAHRENPTSVDDSKFWNVTYRLRDAYGLPDANTRSMHLLFKEIKEDDSKFRKYWNFNDGLHGDAPACNATCKKQRLCQMSAQVHQQMTDCLNGSGQMVASLVLVAITAAAARVFG
ncbi:Acid sphingomyelinase-like phosphodiesterase 3a [Amphibalanus amphitrite]|uniref:Acid sphingomyelinase-like phosphodiesterase 3a n=1 Tax=Amphibalanus amphitrite TaxID=1232801 RepID=A0A6A4V632_AMPAM|nr:acid sphingomyelinase-like phosphodiesterase 3a [Amphibalanus amphitrite]KAF0290066.1 Acid sphingomyelinase-like phosphodiesterase 3a [Amphibalanus amphitrite]